MHLSAYLKVQGKIILIYLCMITYTYVFLASKTTVLSQISGSHLSAFFLPN
jgi:hypothetical protein